MLNLIDDFFHDPLKELDNFRLIKDITSLDKLIQQYKTLTKIQEKQSFMKSLKTILSHDYSIINICFLNNNSSYNLIDFLITEYFLNLNDSINENIHDILKIIVPIIGCNKNNLDTIYSQLSKQYFYPKEDKAIPDIQKLSNFLSILSILYGYKNSYKIKEVKNYNTPLNFYYFKGNEKILISPNLNESTSIKLNDGFSLFISFNCLFNPKYFDKKNNEIIIFSICCNGNIFINLLIDNDMNLIFNITNEKNVINDKSIILSNVKFNKWVTFTFSMCTIKKNKKFHFNAIVNNTPYNDKNEIESYFQNLTDIKNITLCENFIGLLTSFALFNKNIDNKELEYYQKEYKYGLYKLNQFSKYIEKINMNNLKYLSIFFIPIEKVLMITNQDSNNIINLSNNNIDFNIQYISNNNKLCVNINRHFEKKINLLGGIDNILPFFEIINKYQQNNLITQENICYIRDSIKHILNIINTLLVEHKTNIIEISSSNFIEIISLFLENINFENLFNDEIMTLFLSLGTFLFNNKSKYFSLTEKYLNNILLNVKILQKFSIDCQKVIFEFLYKYLKLNSNDNFILEENFLLILEYFHNNQNSIVCCEQHKNFYNSENLNPKKIIELKDLFDLLTKIIGSTIKYDGDLLIKVLHFLSIKNQPCLVKYIIKNIFLPNLSKKDIEINTKKKFIKYLVSNQFFNILLFLQTTYVYPDIISEIINMYCVLSINSSFADIDNFFTNRKNIEYIANSLIPFYIRTKNDISSKKNVNFNISSPMLLSMRQRSLSNANKKNESDDENNIINFKDKDTNEKKLIHSKSNQKIRKKSMVSIQKNISRTIILKNKSISPFGDKKSKSTIRKPFTFTIFDMNNDSNNNSNIKKSKLEIEYEKAQKEYKSLTPLLKKLTKKNLTFFVQTVLDSLLNWLRNNTNKYVIDIITKFFYFEEGEYIHIYKFIETLNMIINEQIAGPKTNIEKNDDINNNIILLFNTNFYFWFIDILFQFYLIHTKKYNLFKLKYSYEENNKENNLLIDNIVKKGIKIITNLIVNIKTNIAYLLKILNDLMLCGTRMKYYYNLNKNNISILNDFYREILSSLLKEYQKYHSLNHSEEIISIINFCYEYMIFFNIENKSDEINNFLINDDQIFNGVILSGINTTNSNINNSTKTISNFWSDYILFENILLIFKSYINITNINYKDDKFLEENILTSKKSDTYLNELTFLCLENSELPLIYIFSNFYVISLNLVQNPADFSKILTDYKNFILFLVLASSNISSNPNITTKVELVLKYFIGYIFERIKNSNNNILIDSLSEVLILMMKVVKKTLDHIQKNKSSKIFNKIISIGTSKKKIDYKNCAVFKIFNTENMANTFTRDYISSQKKNNFKKFNDKKYLVNLLEKSLNIQEIKNDAKKIFSVDLFMSKGKKRIEKIKRLQKTETSNSGKKDEFYDINFFKIRGQITLSIKDTLLTLDEKLNLSKEKNKINIMRKEKLYKKIKKNIFSFSGFWSNKDIFYYNKESDNDKNNTNTLKYKLINHYGKIFFRPILLPIYDINNYFPNFSLFNTENLFINKNNKNNTIIDLNMHTIFNSNININNDNIINDNTNYNDFIIDYIYQSVFTKAYEYYESKFQKNENNDNGQFNPPVSGLITNGHFCCYVTQMSHIKGYINLDKDYFSFIKNFYSINNTKKIKEDYDPDKNTCYGSYVKLNDNKNIYLEIPYKNIKYIFLKKYYYKDSALEIYTSYNKVYYFNFVDSFERQCTLDLLLVNFQTKKEIKIQKNKIIGYELKLAPSNLNISNNTNNNTNYDLLSTIIENWQEWKISTFELLIWLNIFGNRSYNDISQYPVFPWILTQYKDSLSDEKKGKSNTNLQRVNPENKMNIPIKYNSTEIKEKSSNNNIKIKKLNNSNNNSINDKNNINNNNNKVTNLIAEQFNINDLDINLKIQLNKDIRNFTLPMGMMDLNDNCIKRKNNYISKFLMQKNEIDNNEKNNNSNNNSNNKLYVYGSHYSNPVYVCHYLLRIFPFCNIGIELQGDKFDDPNRLLISVSKSFEGATSHESDVRELIPEFFYLPEIFLNINNLDLKINTSRLISSNKNNNKNNSNDVILPKWSGGNAFIFVTKLKIYLESEEVNKKINKWFDLIFGYKQKGKEAESIYNLFFPSSYDSFNIKEEAKTNDQRQYYLRLAEFGLTPHQIINKKFPKRKPKDNKKKAISESLRENTLTLNSFKSKKKENFGELKIIKLKFIDDENVLCISDNFQFIKYEIIQFVMASNIRLDSNTKYFVKKEKAEKLNYSLIKNFKEIFGKPIPIIVYNKGNFIAQGGFFDGKILVNQLNLKNKSKSSSNSESAIIDTFEIYNPMDKSPIVSLIINKNEKVIISGSYYGSVTIYKKKTWKKKYQINDHMNKPITSLFFNDNLNIWGSSGLDGYVNIYTYPTNKKITSIKMDNNALYADYLFIISSPLPSFIIFCKNNSCFYCYSLIGELISKEYEENENSDITSPVIFQDSSFGENLLYGNNNGSVSIRFLPSLNLLSSMEINWSNIDCVEVSDNGRYCAAWSNEEEEFYIVFDPSLISENEELMILHLANDLDE